MNLPPDDWPAMPDKLRVFYDIWQSLRVGNDLPARRQIGLRQIKNLASSLVILELDNAGDLAVRMSGTDVDAVFGRALTQAKIEDIAAPGAGTAVLAFHKALITHPCGAFAHDILTTEAGKRLDARYLILPLKNDKGKPVMCASLWDAPIQSFALSPIDHATRITHTDLQFASFLDIGHGIPNEPCIKTYLETRELFGHA